MNDPVSNPSHYTQGNIECIDALESALGREHFQSFCLGNVIKYIWRYKNKNGLEDLKKARWYLERAITSFDDEKIEDCLREIYSTSTAPCGGCGYYLRRPFESGRWRFYEGRYQHEMQDCWEDCTGQNSKGDKHDKD